MSFTADLLLLVALAATTLSLLAFQRRLNRLDRLNNRYREALVQASNALATAGDHLVTFNRDGRNVLLLLAGRIDAAHELIAQIDARAHTHRPRRQDC